jgi:polysaccharide export outer membrane protein
MGSEMTTVTTAILVLVVSGAVLAQSAGTQQPTNRPPAAEVRDDYVISPQDVLKITVFDEPTFSGTFRVDADGRIQYPFLGRIQAAGQSLRLIEQALAKQLSDGFVLRPQITIEVEQSRTRSIFVTGEVRTPGKYPITGPMTLIEALTAAGSTTQDASNEIVVLRPRQAGAAAGPLDPDADPAMAQRLTMNLTDLLRGRQSENVLLREGDTVVVARLEKFFVTGQVKTPGAYPFERNLTVLQALSLAGGLTEKGSDRGIKAIRVVGGKKTEVDVKLTDPVLAGDTLVIRMRLL